MIINILLFLVLVLSLNEFLLKKKLLGSSTGFKHQLFANKSVPLSGGIILFFPVVFFLFDSYKFFVFTYSFLFILGLLADLNFLISSKKRFFIQFLLILFFVLLLKLEVLPTRILFLDNYIENTFISYLLTIFCLLVLINGSNFIDGLNGLLLGYILIVLFFLNKLSLLQTIGLNDEKIHYFALLFLFLLFLNFNNKLFLGDNGAYSLSFLLGFFLIKIYNLNVNLSPYFIILLLWYPCFENLFSIIRKFKYKSNPLNPDNKHLHQYLYAYIKKKFRFSDLLSNNISSLVINTFNLIIFFLSAIRPEHTIHQLLLLMISIVIYLFSYNLLKKIR